MLRWTGKACRMEYLHHIDDVAHIVLLVSTHDLALQGYRFAKHKAHEACPCLHAPSRQKEVLLPRGGIHPRNYLHATVIDFVEVMLKTQRLHELGKEENQD